MRMIDIRFRAEESVMRMIEESVMLMIDILDMERAAERLRVFTYYIALQGLQFTAFSV